MTDVIDYIRYFQKIANEHVEIKDFYIFNIQEAMNAMREGMQFPAFILNTQKGSALVPHRDNTLDKVTGGFLVIDHLEQVDDFVGVIQHVQAHLLLPRIQRRQQAADGEEQIGFVHHIAGHTGPLPPQVDRHQG